MAVMCLGDKSPSKSKTIWEDSLRIVDPSRKKLVSLETQRIAGVLDECIHRLEIVSALSVLAARPECLEGELGRALQKHLLQSERFLSLNQTPEREEGQRAQAEAVKEIQGSLRNLIPHLRALPTVEEMVRGIGPSPEEAEGSRQLRAGLRELGRVLMERLLTTPAEERERARHMQAVSRRYQSNLQLMATLEKEVAAAIQDRDEEISTQNELISRMKRSLQQMEKLSEDFIGRTRQEAEKQSQSDKKTSDGKQAHMQQEASQLRAQLNSVIAENREKEMALRKKKYKVETEIENWIQKYDADMGEKQTELEEMTTEYEEEKAELQELMEHYAVLEVEYSQIMEERQKAQERREEEERERQVKSKAAVIIQAYWRGFRVRKAMKGKSKGKKAKKGRSKKGK